MAHQLIVGAGAVGTGTALHLAAAGHDVTVVTRSGSGPSHEHIRLVAADATDADRLTELATGAHAILNCANPPAYDKWAEQWPPLAAAMLIAAERVGARLITMSNLYGYAAGSSPMRATDPLDPPTANGRIRVEMWQRALAAHEAGRVRVAEVRASDYVGPGLGETAHLGDRFVPRLLAGKTARVLGDPDAPHSWSYIDDVCRTLATVATDDRALGRAWHVPTLPPRSVREMGVEFTTAAKASPAKVSRIPRGALRAVALVVPLFRTLLEMAYQFDAPFEIDAADTTETFGIEPAPLPDQIAATLAAYSAAPVAA